MFEKPIRKVDIAVFCLLAGLLGTFARGYAFGAGNQVGHLPILLRVLDPSYLPNDFFVNVNDGFAGPRYYYAQLLAVLAAHLPVHVVFLLLAIFAKTMLALVTFHVAGKLHAGSALAAMLSVALVMSVDAFTLGGASSLIERELAPAALVRPVALLSLWMALNGRLFWCSALAMAAIPIHPLVGFETAGIGLAAFGIYTFWQGFLARNVNPRQTMLRVAGVLVATGVLVLFSYTIFPGGAERTLSTSQFVHIVAQCRAPHHYLPSTFAWRDYCFAGFFFLAMWLAWKLWRHEKRTDGQMPSKLLLVNGLVILSLVGGYLFVEVSPSRLWVTAQTFRNLYIANWLGLILFGGSAARIIARRRSFVGSAPGWCVLMGTGPHQPTIVLTSHVLHLVQRSIRSRYHRGVLGILTGLFLVVIVSFASHAAWTEAQSVALIAGLGFWFLLVPQTWYRTFAPTVAVFGVVCLLVLGYHVPRMVRPIVSLDETDDPCYDVAVFAQDHTPGDAVFLVPPDVGNFRVLANRAVVVQWKAFPFGDAGITEWYERMRDCYSDSASDPLGVLSELIESYRRIPAQRIQQAADKYGAAYAVLYAETPSDAPVLYEDSYYKLVDLGG